MTSHAPSLQAILFLGTFVVVYLLVLVRNAVREQIDTYDFILLSAVAAIPAVFVLFPESMWQVTRIVGVEFPFLLLFGGVLVVAFVMLWRNVRHFAALRKTMVNLTQEHALLSDEVGRLRRAVVSQGHEDLR